VGNECTRDRPHSGKRHVVPPTPVCMVRYRSLVLIYSVVLIWVSATIYNNQNVIGIS
jgi:hypothetical protein